jgi:hypothetical protein
MNDPRAQNAVMAGDLVDVPPIVFRLRICLGGRVFRRPGPFADPQKIAAGGSIAVGFPAMITVSKQLNQK